MVAKRNPHITASDRLHRRHRRLHLETLEGRQLLASIGGLSSMSGSHMHDVMVTDTAVVTPHDTVPRFGANPTNTAITDGLWSVPSTWNAGRVPGLNEIVRIPSGIRVQYDVDSEVKLDVIEVGGHLEFATGTDTSLWLNELMVMPSGVLTIGTQDAPVASSVTAEIVFTDTPGTNGHHFKTGTVESPGIDPSQYGNGLLAFGTVVMHGRPLQDTFIRLAEDAAKGTNTLELRAEDVGWQVGDRVVLPDTRHTNPVSTPNYYEYLPQWETRTIVGVDGSTLILDTALDFDHLGPHDADGTRSHDFDGHELAPHVGNLTRNIVLRSENPDGVRGHTMYFSQATKDTRYVAFQDLGRTKARSVDSTIFDAAGNVTHIGSNQAGRYSEHHHHLIGPLAGIELESGGDVYQWISMGNAVEGALKWGTAIHGAHYGLLADSVYFGANGSAVATEDGSEFGNRIEGNFVVAVHGGVDGFNGLGESLVDHGDQGDGFWFAGPMNFVHENVVANARRNAFVIWPDNVPNTRNSSRFREVMVPTFQGANPRIPGEGRLVNLLEEPVDSFVGNEIYGATTGVIQIWSVGNRSFFPEAAGMNTLTDTVVWHVTGIGIRFYYADSYLIDGWIQRGDPYMIQRGVGDGGPSHPASGAAIVHAGSRARESTVIRADIQNMTYGYINRGRGVSDEVRLSDSFLDNHFNVLSWPWSQNPTDGSRDFLLDAVVFGDAVNPGANNTIDMQWRAPSVLAATTPETFYFRNYNGIDGLNLRIYYAEQAPGVDADKVPPGAAPAGHIAPTAEVDGDVGQAATIRGKAMGIEGLVFETSTPLTPTLFVNVELSFGVPTLFFAVLGDASEVSQVEFTIDGQTFVQSGIAGSLSLNFLNAGGQFAIEGSAYSEQGHAVSQVHRKLSLPLRTAPRSGKSNQRPVLDPIGARAVVAMDLLAFTLSGSDPDHDVIQFHATDLPPGASLDSSSGEFRWTPTNKDAGEHVVRFSVVDEHGASANERVQISVAFNSQLDPVVGWWELSDIDEASQTADRSIYGHDGVVLGPVPLANGGMRFAGGLDVVVPASSEAFRPRSALTLSVRAKPNGGANHFARLIGFDSGSIPAYELSVKDHGSMNDEKGLLQGYWFSVRTEMGTSRVSFRHQQWDGSSWDNVTAVFDGTRDGGSLELYVNGELKDSLTGVGTTIVYPTFGQQRLLIGGDGIKMKSFVGSLADVRVLAAAAPPLAAAGHSVFLAGYRVTAGNEFVTDDQVDDADLATGNPPQQRAIEMQGVDNRVVAHADAFGNSLQSTKNKPAVDADELTASLDLLFGNWNL